MRVALYARYSSELQKDRSIEDQLALLTQFAGRQGWRIVQTFEDRALSGASMIGRDGIMALMEQAKKRVFDAVLVESLDRLSRDVGDLDGLFKRLTHWGIQIQTVHEGTTDRLKVGIRGIVGALYLEDLSQKVRRGMSGQAREGKNTGGRAYGYRAVPGKPGELVIEEGEAEIIRRIFSEYLGGRSPKMIAHRLNTDGIPAPRTKLWKANTILGDANRAHGILRNKRYIGEVCWNKVTYRRDPDTRQRTWIANPNGDWVHKTGVEHLRIVDDETFEAVQHLLERFSKKPQGAAKRPKHLLSGLVKCGACGGTFVFKGSHEKRPRLECSTKKESGSCSHGRTYYADEITSLLFKGLADTLSCPEAIREYLAEYRAERERLAQQEGKIRDRLARQLQSVRSSLERLVDALANGLATADTVRDKILSQENERERLCRELESIPSKINVVELHPAAVTRYIQHIETLSENVAKGEVGDEDRNSLRQLVDRIIVYPTEPGHLDLQVMGKLSALLGDAELPPTARLRAGDFVGAG